MPVLLIALVYSLLLEDFSSVELKDTRDLVEKHRLLCVFFCGNGVCFVEMGRSRVGKVAANAKTDIGVLR